MMALQHPPPNTDTAAVAGVSQISLSNRATPSENADSCLTRIARQIWELWYRCVIKSV